MQRSNKSALQQVGCVAAALESGTYSFDVVSGSTLVRCVERAVDVVNQILQSGVSTDAQTDCERIHNGYGFPVASV